MELKIYWTDFSKQELKEIYNYYIEKASITVKILLSESQKKLINLKINQQSAKKKNY